jgi:hypothetical protein
MEGAKKTNLLFFASLCVRLFIFSLLHTVETYAPPSELSIETWETWGQTVPLFPALVSRPRVSRVSKTDLTRG